MNSEASAIARPETGPVEAHTGMTRFLRRRFLASLKDLRDCELRINDDGEEFVLGTPLAGREPLRAQIDVVSSEFYRRLALNGSVGVAEA